MDKLTQYLFGYFAAKGVVNINLLHTIIDYKCIVTLSKDFTSVCHTCAIVNDEIKNIDYIVSVLWQKYETEVRSYGVG